MNSLSMMQSCTVCLLVWMATSAGHANDGPDRRADDRPQSIVARVVRAVRSGHDMETEPAPVVILEMAERWLPALVDRPFEIRLPIDVWALGSRVRGGSKAAGHYTIHCVEGEGPLCFEIQAGGTSTAKTRSRKRAATIHTTTVTRFEARKRIELREWAFANGDTTVEAMQTLSVRSHVEPHFRIGRRLVRRVAQQRMRKKQDEIERVRRRLTEERILEAVDRSVEQATETAETLLWYVLTARAWTGWDGRDLPLQMQTGEGLLRLVYRVCEGDHPVFAAVAASRWGESLRAVKIGTVPAAWFPGNIATVQAARLRVPRGTRSRAEATRSGARSRP